MTILTNDMKCLVREQRLGFVATVCPDGTPNLSPKGTLAPWGDDSLVFAHLHSAKTVENLKWNSAIEINVVDVWRRKGYRFKGTAEVLTDGHLFEEIMQWYRVGSDHEPLHDAGRRVRALVVTTVYQALPLISPAYDDGSSEETILGQWAVYWRKLHG